MIAWLVEFQRWPGDGYAGETAFLNRAQAEQFAHITLSAEDHECTAETLEMTRKEAETCVDYSGYGTPSAIVRRITIIQD